MARVRKLLPAVVRRGSAGRLVLEGKPFLMLGGELHNSSASSLKYMEPIWPRLKGMHCNTVLATVSWELVEAEEGRFDFSIVTGLVEGARRHGLKLVLLWFGTLKNAFSTYVPTWVKTDLKRFPRAKSAAGKRRGACTVFSEEMLRCDARAFRELMKHVREIDGEEQTVVMVQVENEVGILEQARDFCEEAEAAFARGVPTELMDYLKGHREGLRAELREAWGSSGFRESGGWTEVFGKTGEEIFMAWGMGKFVEGVAAAGSAEYGLPMFANAWMTGNPAGEAGKYPSGGPVGRMMDVWKAAAPHIFTLAPDNYDEEGFAAACADYARGDNPLLIPEARRDHWAPACVWYAIGEHDAMCFAPFGIDSVGMEDPAIVNAVQAGIVGQNATGNAALLAESFRVITSMMGVICEHQGAVNGEREMIGILQGAGELRVMRELGGYDVEVFFNEERRTGVTPAAGLMIAMGPDEFLVAGHGFRIRLWAKGRPGVWVENLWIDEGEFVEGKWVAGRRLNGDEGAVRLATRKVEVRWGRFFGLEV